jgi:hypothetical protein
LIEVKRRGAKPTEDQLALHEELRMHGSVVVVATDPEDVVRALKQIDERNTRS